jgi:hypothetical protein
MSERTTVDPHKMMSLGNNEKLTQPGSEFRTGQVGFHTITIVSPELLPPKQRAAEGIPSVRASVIGRKKLQERIHQAVRVARAAN